MKPHGAAFKPTRTFSLRNASGEPFVFYEWGEPGAPTVLLHHATGFCGQSWGPMVAALGWGRVVALDARGHGASEKAVSNVSWDGFAEDLAEIAEACLRELDISAFCCAVGHSLGGTAVLGAAVHSPALFQRTLLLDPVLIPAPDPGGRTPFSMRTRMRRVSYPDEASVLEHLQQRCPTWDAEVVRAYARGALFRAQDGSLRLSCEPNLEASIYELGETPVLGRLAQLETPTRLLSASRGRFGPGHRLAAELSPHVDCRTLEVEHAFPLESPGLVARELRAYLLQELTSDHAF